MAIKLNSRMFFSLTIWFAGLISCSDASGGKEFYLVFMQHFTFANPALRNLTVSFSNPNPASVRVEVNCPGLNFPRISQMLEGWQSLTLTLPHDVILEEGAIKYSKSIYITSSDDIFVHANSDYDDGSQRSASGFMLLPTTSLASEYVAVTHCVVVHCIIVVTSVEDSNYIQVHVRITSAGTAQYAGWSYANGQIITETLEKGESMQVLCYQCDMTGSWVQASRKVAVFGGESLQGLLFSRNNYDAIAEQMIPTGSLGTSYVLGSNYNSPILREVVKVVLLNPGDRFTFNGTTYTASMPREVFVFEERNMADIAEIRGEQPILVAEVIAGQTSSDYPDVSLVLPLPVERWNTSYAAYIPNLNSSLPHEEVIVCLVTSSETDPAWIEAVVGSPPELTTVFSGDAYTMLWLEYKTEGLVGLMCTNENCDPFGGFVVHNRDKRSSVYGLVPAYFELPTQTSTVHLESTSNTAFLQTTGTTSREPSETTISNQTLTEPATKALTDPKTTTTVDSVNDVTTDTVTTTGTSSSVQTTVISNDVTTDNVTTTGTGSSGQTTVIPIDVTTRFATSENESTQSSQKMATTSGHYSASLEMERVIENVAVLRIWTSQ